MTVGRSIRDPRAVVVIVLCALLISIPAMVTIGSRTSEASIFPVNVRGYIMDLAGNKIQGANVTVEMVNETTGLVTTTLYNDSTSLSGLYQVSFPIGTWDPGDTIRVTARFGITENQNSTIARDRPIMYVNVTLSTEIPEFGSLFGVPTTLISVGLIATIITIYRRRR